MKRIQARLTYSLCCSLLLVLPFLRPPFPRLFPQVLLRDKFGRALDQDGETLRYGEEPLEADGSIKEGVKTFPRPRVYQAQDLDKADNSTARLVALTLKASLTLVRRPSPSRLLCAQPPNSTIRSRQLSTSLRLRAVNHTTTTILRSLRSSAWW